MEWSLSGECTCIHGTCNSGPLGDGLCDMSVGCSGLFTGDNCHRHSMPCSSISSVQGFCHAHAQCIWNELRGDYSCICRPGYKGNGLDCEEIDLCTEKLRGGCHLQATCKKTNPGQRNCTCNKGWSGDGLYCYPASSCSNHSDCDTNSQCIETIPGEHICKCNSGYHGDGKSCVLTDMCTVNNGNCHPKAACVAVGPGQVNCTCSVDLGYTGNGYSCYGNLMKQVQDHSDLTITANLLETLDLDDIELFLDDDYTVFIPTDTAISAFMRKTSASYWQKKENSFTLLNYHTLPNKTSIVELVAMSAVYKKFETMADGFSVHIFKEGKTVILSPGEGSPVRAKVLEADIVATNGYLNVIDQVLEPYYPDPPDTYPDLETFFNTTPQCSIFGKWLKEKNLLKRLEDDLNEYTLFIPSDTYARTVNVTVTRDYLRYYFIPRMRLMASVYDGETAVTDLGIRYQLVYNVLGWDKFSVNNIPISTPDIFTLGGVVNIIDGLLHPVLHTCNETRKSVEFGICHECTTSYLCPEGYMVYKGADEVQDCTYAVKSWFGNRAVKGCRGLCVIDKVIEGCCSGYYGPSCQECPGGPETPCHGGGHCSDGITGNGQCVCTGHFTGLACDKCIHGWTGTKCDIDMYGCGYRNGGCHKAAVCHRGDDGRISCKCASGYRGNGYNCTGPCEINNGGCHINANCLYKAAVGITCSCKAGYVGNGKDACNSDIFSTLLTLDGASQFVKSVLLANDGNKTLDLLQTSGNEKLTVLVPVDSSLNNRILSASELQHQIALSNDTVTLSSITPHTYLLRTLAGDAVIIRYDSQSSKFLANNTKVSQSDIMCTNGVIHLVSSAFTKPSVRSQSPETAPPIIAIVVPVVVIVVLVTMVIVAVMIYKKTQFGYWKLFHKWVPNKESGSDTTSEARLSFNDPDSPRSSSGSTGNTNFGNPLFQMNEDDL